MEDQKERQTTRSAILSPRGLGWPIAAGYEAVRSEPGLDTARARGFCAFHSYPRLATRYATRRAATMATDPFCVISPSSSSWSRARSFCCSSGLFSAMALVGDGSYRRRMCIEVAHHDMTRRGCRIGECRRLACRVATQCGQ